MEDDQGSSEGVSAPVSSAIRADAVALAKAMSKALRAMDEAPPEIAGAVDEHVAAARLGISLSALRYDRRAGKLGIPFIKMGEGKRGLVRYDLADLDAWVASRKRVVRPAQRKPEPIASKPEPRRVPQPVAPAKPAAPWTAPEAPTPRSRSPWSDPLPPTEADPFEDDETEDDPFAQSGRAVPTQQRRYWTG
jgi:hypothetical protein